MKDIYKEAYSQGYQACCCGVPSTGAPEYSDIDELANWNDGWEDADADYGEAFEPL